MADDMYEETWLDSCYQETILPGSPWKQVREIISQELAKRLMSLPPKSEATKCICYLLGQHFVDEYCKPPALIQGQSSYVYSTPSKEEHDLAIKWIQKEINSIVGDLRLRDGKISSAVWKLKDFGQRVIYRGMEKELLKAENEEKSNPKADDLHITGIQSETLGLAIKQILLAHPNRLQTVCQRLHGHQLPSTLRQLIWKIKLYQGDTLETQDIKRVIEDAHQEFAEAISWGVKELGISSAVCSPIDGVIRHAVREMFHSSPALQDREMMTAFSKVATEVLNLIYVHKRTYEPYYALLLLPIICTYTKDVCSEHDSMELAELLSHFLKTCFPSRIDIFATADRVMSRLQSDDPELHQHLCITMQTNITHEPQEFLVNFVHTEREKAKSIGSQQTKDNLPSNAKTLLSHPIIFMRKWIGEGFVSVLDQPSLLFIWDQCFLSSWSCDVLEKICHVLLQLSRPRLIKTDDYNSLKKALMTHSSTLYTRDIQRGLMHLLNGGSLSEVANLSQPSQLSLQSLDLPTTSSPSHASRANQSPLEFRRTQDDGQATPAATANPQPAASRVSLDLGPLWVGPKVVAVMEDAPVTNDESFDVYIDEVRFIPDNATVIKVTGRILDPFWRKPTSLDVPDIEAYAILDSPARCPTFHFRYRVGSPTVGVPADIALFLRVYTVNVTSAELLVIGNCAVKLYREHDGMKLLNTGGYQRRLIHELPSTADRLTENAFEEKTNVPAVTILFRILPHSEEFMESPGYTSGSYTLSNFHPNDSEEQLSKHYKAFQPYPPTVREAIRDVMEEEQEHSAANARDQVIEDWYKQRMSKVHLQGKPAKAIDLREIVQYDRKQGMYIKVEQAFGLPSAQFVNTFIHLSKGPTARHAHQGEERDTGDVRLLQSTRDFNSLQKSPIWTDQPKIFHPDYDNISSLIIRLYSLDATYEPRLDQQGPGQVTARGGRTPALSPQGWTVVPLFYRKSVNVGKHYLPLFQGTPSLTFLDFLSGHPGDVSLREAIKQDVHKLQGFSSVVVKLWDGHISETDSFPLPLQENLLSIGKSAKIKRTMQDTSGKALSDIVLQCLPRQQRKQGREGEACNREKKFYEEAMNMAFKIQMEDVLLQLGLSPLD
ncbi:uncharacterized protein LOC116617677 [Nematostella vectensis]|uniref:uncharacterized protein LOC116617677 n=1 Tax=Nematostella vectensis TaxID=45351 RepID=UPI0020771B76|nr:uncharacterized protein LOC116617677 [Nematostella vectensis]